MNIVEKFQTGLQCTMIGGFSIVAASLALWVTLILLTRIFRAFNVLIMEFGS